MSEQGEQRYALPSGDIQVYGILAQSLVTKI